MSLERLVSRYVDSAEQVFHDVVMARNAVSLDVGRVREVLDYAKAYLEDAKYYGEKKKFEVSLTSVAYCEGLLDALRLLGAVKFEWPAKVKEPRKAK
jgi:hypothetical protein